MRWAAANATVLDVRKPTTVGGVGYDDDGEVIPAAADVGDPVWEGELEDSQLRRERRTVVSGGQSTRVDRDVLMVRRPPPALTDAEAGTDPGGGYTVLVRDERKQPFVTRRFRITAVEHGGIRASEAVRYELEDEQP